MEKVPTVGREKVLTEGPETVLTLAMEEVLTLPMENLLDIHTPSSASPVRGRGTRISVRRPGISAAPSSAASPSPPLRLRRSRLPGPPSSQVRGRNVESSPCVRLPPLRILSAKWNATGKGRRTAPRGAVRLEAAGFLHVSWKKGHSLPTQTTEEPNN